MSTYKISIPRHAKVFLLEDNDTRIAWFRERLPSITIARTADEALVTLALETFDFVFLDHDLGVFDKLGTEHTGREVARFLSGKNYSAKNVVIHSRNPAAAAMMTGAHAIPFGKFEIEFSD